MALRCSKCKQTKPVADFVKESATSRGYRYDCKDCSKVRSREKRLERQAKWSKHDPWQSHATGEKVCTRCKINKSVDEYSRDRNQPDGLQYWCRKCQIIEWQMRKYGQAVKPEDVCMICGCTESLCVDHCHTTMQTRGVLCRWCNTVLGHARDNPDVLRKAASYLEGNL